MLGNLLTSAVAGVGTLLWMAAFGLPIIATLIGGVLFGFIGAVIAIPVAAAVQLVLLEVAVPSAERM